MATTKIPVELSSTPGIVDNSNATAITINSSENVGVGTSNPAEKLEVSGGHIKISNAGNTNLYINANNAGSDATIFFEEQDSIKAKIQHDASNDSLLFTDGSYADTMTLKGAKVGIGETAPDTFLHVKGTGGGGQGTVKLEGQSAHLGFTRADGNFRSWIGQYNSTTHGSDTDLNIKTGYVGGSSSTGNIRISADGDTTAAQLYVQGSTGNVGIGTTSPGHALDVVGTGKPAIEATCSAGHFAIEASTPYDYVAKFSSTDSGAAIVLQDNTSTNHANRINVAGNTMQFITGATTAVTINASQNVGIGESNPDAPLHITSNTPIIAYDESDTSQEFRLGVFGGAFALYDSNDSTFRMLVDGNGKVGIGTTSPNGLLHIGDSNAEGSSANPAIQVGGANTYRLGFYTDSEGGIIQNLNGDNGLQFRVKTAGEVMRIMPSGNVGIGTTSPGTNLHIGSGTEGENLGLKINRGSTTNFLVACDGTKQAYIGVDSSEGFMKMGSLSNHPVRISQNNANAIYIDTSKNIGIGTTSPGHKVHIYGGSAHTNLVISTADGYKAELRMTEDAAGTTHGGFIRYDGNGDYVRLGTYNAGAESINLSLKDDTKIGTGGITVPQQNFAVGTTTNYDPPGLGSSNANFAVLKKDGSTGGNYGIITGVSSDGNVWTQVQRTDGTATGYNYYLQPSGGNVGIGVPQNHTYIPNLTSPLHVCKVRSGVGNVSDYLTHLAIEALGYAGNNYQLGCIDFNGGDTAGAHNPYARIGCSTMVGTNNQETGSLEFYVKAPNFGLSGTTHAMKITGKADTSSAGGGTTRNGVLFTYQGIAIDRSWSDYPGIAVMNATPYSSTASTQSELRIHGTNISSASYPSTSGSDFSVVTRSDGGYATGSDRRRKKNITTIDNALSTVKQLTGKRFQTVNSADEVQEHVSKNGYKFGFIAQEVEDIIPETVQYHADEDDGTDNYNTAYAMDYGSVVALLVNAIKEQDTTIVALEARIKALEDK